MNPIISRELISHLRLPRRFFALFCYQLLATVIFCGVYSTAIQQMAWKDINGRGGFYGLIFLSCLLVFPVISLAAASIAQEKEADTWDLLLTTPIRIRSILWGKLVAVLSSMLLFLFSFTPVLFLSFVLGGLSPLEVILSVLILFSFYSLAAMIGITVSLYTRSSSRAVQLAIIFLIMYLAGSLLTSLYGLSLLEPLFIGKPGVIAGGFLQWILTGFFLSLWINPVWSLISQYNLGLLQNSSIAVRLPFIFSWAGYLGIIPVISNVILSGLLFLLAWYRLSRRLRAGESRWELKKESGASTSTSATDSIEPYFASETWAIIQKEFLSANRRWISNIRVLFIATCLLAFGLSYWLFFTARISAGETFSVLYILTAILGYVVVCMASTIAPSYAIFQEYIRDTWPILRTTTLRSRAIVLGHVITGFTQAALPLLALIVTLYLGATIFSLLRGRYGMFHSESIFYLLIFYLACAFFYSSAGVYFSSFSQNRKTAPQQRTFAVALIHAALPFMLYGICALMFLPFFYTWNPELNALFTQITNWIERVVFPFSPLWIIQNFEWSDRDLLTTLFHIGVLLALSAYLIQCASRKIQSPE